MEKWDVYNANGEFTGITKTQNDIWNDDEYHLGASLWIVNKNREVLIQKRAPTKRRCPGIWCNIGGSVVAGEDSRRGCVREVYEEIGIKLSIDDIVFLSRLYSKNTINDDYAVIYDFPIEMTAVQPEEVSEVRWVSIDEIKELFARGLFLMDSLDDLSAVTRFIDDNPGWHSPPG